jgi:hypothetical protein
MVLDIDQIPLKGLQMRMTRFSVYWTGCFWTNTSKTIKWGLRCKKKAFLKALIGTQGYLVSGVCHDRLLRFSWGVFVRQCDVFLEVNFLDDRLGFISDRFYL